MGSSQKRNIQQLQGGGANVVGQANDMRPWRPSEDTKVIEILLGPDFHEQGKRRTVDDIFVRDEMSHMTQWRICCSAPI
jgi:hypothetical protein